MSIETTHHYNLTLNTPSPFAVARTAYRFAPTRYASNRGSFHR